MSDAPRHEHSSFYKFVALSDAERVAERLRELCRELGGNVLVAPEGISGALGGLPAALDAFELALVEDPIFESAFRGIQFKRSFCTTRPFTLCKVHVKPELVAFGLEGVSGLDDARTTHVSPQDWHQLIAREDVVLLDNRNSFEWKLGHFRGAIDPGVRHFRDFPAYVQAHAEAWKQAGKTVAMYCTGGIRCEKIGGWMSRELGLQVAQLDGGILNYFEQTGGEDWQGECFVFDKRIAIDPQREETATTAEQVFGDDPDEAWRLARARRLDPAG
ncbi:rhodanese-like domain-containing protein [Pelomonas sp. SE-A7]|uniref:oxygen-dependent tRNA uridine(34) hydroxylase TrhO n=1 Tax=Pelomonas sp. SE-A7 TaxID=3054953 RepID=UPI00259CF467|nr:rhodanese-like domain-containing protein [Pelomonas sp. SE-A7]MDM4766503.1 rhodanese-like domain-containing protein [Pelomonas sp. SE-A7]